MIIRLRIQRRKTNASTSNGDPGSTDLSQTNTNKPRDASTAHGRTAAESVRALLKKNPRYSKRINYEALRELFDTGPGPSAGGAAVRKEGEAEAEGDGGTSLYFMDKEEEDDGMLVVVEEPGAFVPGSVPPPGAGAGGSRRARSVSGRVDGEGDEDGDEEDGDEGEGEGEVYPEWDAYEQEV